MHSFGGGKFPNIDGSPEISHHCDVIIEQIIIKMISPICNVITFLLGFGSILTRSVSTRVLFTVNRPKSVF